jgi:hypothetical protein
MNTFHRVFSFLIFFLSLVVSLNFVHAGELIVYSDQGIEILTFPDPPPSKNPDENWELKSVECIYNCDEKESTSRLPETGTVEEEELDKSIPTNIYLSVNIVPPTVVQPTVITGIWPTPFYNLHRNPNWRHRVSNGFDKYHTGSMSRRIEGYYQTGGRYRPPTSGSIINPIPR